MPEPSKQYLTLRKLKNTKLKNAPNLPLPATLQIRTSMEVHMKYIEHILAKLKPGKKLL